MQCISNLGIHKVVHHGIVLIGKDRRNFCRIHAGVNHCSDPPFGVLLLTRAFSAAALLIVTMD